MDPKIALNERTLLKAQNAFQRTLIAGLVLLNILWAGVMAWLIAHQETVVVPPEVRRPYEIGASYVNKDYLSDMANYVLSMIGTVTPDSVDYNNTVILKMTHPDGYSQIKTELDGAAVRIKSDRITTVWTPRTEQIDEATQTVVIGGTLKTFIADKLTSTHERRYLVQFTVTISGRLYVSKMQEIVDDGGANPASGGSQR